MSTKTKLHKWETEWGISTTSTFTNTNQADFIARRLLEESGLGVEHSFIYEFQDNGPELYGVDSSNPTTPKVAFYVVQRIISGLAGVRGGSSFVTIKSVSNGGFADVKAFPFQGSTNQTILAFSFPKPYPPHPPPP